LWWCADEGLREGVRLWLCDEEDDRSVVCVVQKSGGKKVLRFGKKKEISTRIQTH
jgi:hypothetical protein